MRETVRPEVMLIQNGSRVCIWRVGVVRDGDVIIADIHADERKNESLYHGSTTDIFSDAVVDGRVYRFEDTKISKSIMPVTVFRTGITQVVDYDQMCMDVQHGCIVRLEILRRTDPVPLG